MWPLDVVLAVDTSEICVSMLPTQFVCVFVVCVSFLSYLMPNLQCTISVFSKVGAGSTLHSLRAPKNPSYNHITLYCHFSLISQALTIYSDL